jgi:hypothetical protein
MDFSPYSIPSGAHEQGAALYMLQGIPIKSAFVVYQLLASRKLTSNAP